MDWLIFWGSCAVAPSPAWLGGELHDQKDGVDYAPNCFQLMLLSMAVEKQSLLALNETRELLLALLT